MLPFRWAQDTAPIGHLRNEPQHLGNHEPHANEPRRQKVTVSPDNCHDCLGICLTSLLGPGWGDSGETWRERRSSWRRATMGQPGGCGDSADPVSGFLLPGSRGAGEPAFCLLAGQDARRPTRVGRMSDACRTRFDGQRCEAVGRSSHRTATTCSSSLCLLRRLPPKVPIAQKMKPNIV